MQEYVPLETLIKVTKGKILNDDRNARPERIKVRVNGIEKLYINDRLTTPFIDGTNGKWYLWFPDFVKDFKFDQNDSTAGSIAMGGVAIGATSAVADGPLPIGDAIGALIIVGALLIAGGVLVYDTVTAAGKISQAIDNLEKMVRAEQAASQAKSDSLARTKIKDPKSRTIYRKGSGNGTNLTPRIVDVNGLSYQLSVPVVRPYTFTTMEAVNATGILLALKDGPDHVSIVPLNRAKMQEWINSRPNALSSPHPFTQVSQTLL